MYKHTHLVTVLPHFSVPAKGRCGALKNNKSAIHKVIVAHLN